MDDFKGRSIKIEEKINYFEIRNYLGYFDIVQKYDENTKYNMDPFEVDDKRGKTKKYEYQLVEIMDEKYVVGIEIITDEELEKLKNFCQCKFCLSPVLHICTYFIDPEAKFCLHFLKDNKPCPKVLKDTRSYYYY